MARTGKRPAQKASPPKRGEAAAGERLGVVEKRKKISLDGALEELELREAELGLQRGEIRAKDRQLEDIFHVYTEIYQKSPAGLVSINARGVIIEINASACELLGLPREKVRLRGFSQFVHEENRKDYFKFLGELKHPLATRCGTELRLEGQGAAPRHVRLDAAALRDAEDRPRGWLLTLLDISARKTAQEALQEACMLLRDSESKYRSLSGRLLTVQEEERKRVARELHDSIGQSLAFMKFRIENGLAADCGRNPEEAVRLLERLIPVVQSSMDEVRSICTGLRPAILDDLGIVAAIQWFARTFRRSYPAIRLEITIDIEEGNVPEGLKIVLFRIVQEALNNAAKHSGAELAQLALAEMDGAIELTVRDYGTGFDRAMASNSAMRNGMGLASMKERAELAGGSLDIESTEGAGTSIKARWPR